MCSYFIVLMLVLVIVIGSPGDLIRVTGETREARITNDEETSDVRRSR
ncbi:MAG TPA: hypothetical protein VFX07_01575 [Candidatus Udaeobacter sp.]|nr:hypothetical protein [Candidatus Udaeobacter sp.]